MNATLTFCKKGNTSNSKIVELEGIPSDVDKAALHRHYSEWAKLFLRDELGEGVTLRSVEYRD